MSIYDEIKEERKKQEEKWGGPEHDDKHTNFDWIVYLTKHVGKAVMYPYEHTAFRKQLVRVAALAIAALESIDRKTK